MKRFYVYRSGYNAANNSAMSGGPSTVRVAEVQAESADEACRLAQEEGVTCYNNQHMYAEDADEEDAKAAERSSRVQLC